MSKNPTERIERRRQEIIDNFLALFAEKRFNEIHIKLISERTAFTRATIYNYFKNIDEIFISAYRQEYLRWTEQLESILREHEKLTGEEFAALIAESLSERRVMLRFSLENFHEKEANCRREFIFDHKAAFSRVIDLMHDCLKKFFPEMSEDDIVRRLYIFFPFMHGLYRYVDITPVQEEAREASHILLGRTTLYDLAYAAVLQILK